VESSFAIRVFVNKGGTWTQTARLPQAVTPPNIKGVASPNIVDSSGNGLVYVYSENSATPTVPQVLTSSEPTPDSTFGSSISIWNQTILVGAPGAYGQPNDNTGGYFSGAAYVFTQGAHGWILL
jgi:FG-GAP repeat